MHTSDYTGTYIESIGCFSRDRAKGRSKLCVSNATLSGMDKPCGYRAGQPGNVPERNGVRP